MTRHALPADERRNDPLRIRLTPAERAALDAAAAPQPTSTWARRVLLAAAQRFSKKPRRRTP